MPPTRWVYGCDVNSPRRHLPIVFAHEKGHFFFSSFPLSEQRQAPVKGQEGSSTLFSEHWSLVCWMKFYQACRGMQPAKVFFFSHLNCLSFIHPIQIRMIRAVVPLFYDIFYFTKKVIANFGQQLSLLYTHTFHNSMSEQFLPP